MSISRRNSKKRSAAQIGDEMIVNRVLVKSVKGSSEDIANTVLANFVPQHHYSINVVMRYVAGSRRVVDAWRSYSTKIRHRKYIRRDRIEIKGEECSLISSSNSIINEFPFLIGYGKNIAIIIDYRLTLGLMNMKRYYRFYKNVNKSLIQSVEDDVERVNNKMQKYGLLGFGPHGLFAFRTDNRERMLREEFEELFRGSITDEKFMEAIIELDRKFSDDVRASLYLHFPSELEASVFGDALSKAFKNLSEKLRIIEIPDEKKSLRDLADEYDVVVALTTDPLTLLPMGRELEDEMESTRRSVDIGLLTSLEDETLIEGRLKNIVNIVKRVFMVYYAGLYLNLTRDYYEKLYEQVRKIGDLCGDRKSIGNRDYQEPCNEKYKKYIESEDYRKACRIPILALAIDGSFRPIMVRGFNDVLPVVKRSKKGDVFEILSPDVTVTVYDTIINDFLKKLPSFIVKHIDIGIKVHTLSNEKFNERDSIIDTYKSKTMYELIKLAKEEVRARIRARDIDCHMRGICYPLRLDDLETSDLEDKIPSQDLE